MIGPVAVKQDLALSCYKPSESISQRVEQAPEASIWELVSEHLSKVSKFLKKDGKALFITERDPRIIYDRIISYYVQHGYPIPMNSNEFQQGLREHYIERDGMFFSSADVVIYDEEKKYCVELVPMGLIVGSEIDGIEWLRNRLRDNPQTYQEIQPEWMQAISGIRKGDVLPELRELLEENFIEDEGGYWRLPNIQDDVDKERIRERSLLREFKAYVEMASKPKAKIKEVRVEAIRAGFKHCYINKDFATIILVGDKIPQNLLSEDAYLLQFYDIACTRV